MYPRLRDGVEIGTVTYEGTDKVFYYAENAKGEEFEISERVFYALYKADGTEPLDLPDGGKAVLPKLKRCGIVTTSRFRKLYGCWNGLILMPIGRRGEKYRPLCRKLGRWILPVSLAVFLLGLCLAAVFRIRTEGELNLPVYVLLLAFSLLCHEYGHLIAGLAGGYRFTELAILLLGIIPVGAYVLPEDESDYAEESAESRPGKEDKVHAEQNAGIQPGKDGRECVEQNVRSMPSKEDKVRFLLAGIEVNFLLAGIFMILALLITSGAVTLRAAAGINVALAVLNLLPANGLDGEQVLSALLEVDSIEDVAKKQLRSRKRRRYLLHSGLPGIACFCLFSFSLLCKFIIWILIGLDAVSLAFLIIFGL